MNGLGTAGAALCGGLAGAAIGSFLGTALVRMPEGRSIVTGRSACDSCGRRLALPDLVPVASWLLLRGRCRTCGAGIGLWQVALEIGAALVGALPWLFLDDPLHAGSAVLLGWQALLLGTLDARHLWLPRVPVLVLALTGLAGAWLAGDGDFARLQVALVGGVIGYGVLALVGLAYRRLRGVDGLGRGDPPLLGAIGLWLGPLGVVEALLGASLVGIAAAIAMLLLGRRVAADTALPLGTCLLVAAWPLFCLQGFG